MENNDIARNDEDVMGYVVNYNLRLGFVTWGRPGTLANVICKMIINHQTFGVPYVQTNPSGNWKVAKKKPLI